MSISTGLEMPKFNIKAYNAQKLADKEAKRAKNISASMLAAASRSQTSPINLSEPHANTDFLDIPCTPITHIAESTESQATRIEEGARAPS